MQDKVPGQPGSVASTGSVRRAYERPRLTAFGLLRELTTGGTGNASENLPPLPPPPDAAPRP